MIHTGIYLSLQITDVSNGIRCFQMLLRVTATADTEISLRFDILYQLIGIMEIMLYRDIGIHISPECQYIFNACFL